MDVHRELEDCLLRSASTIPQLQDIVQNIDTVQKFLLVKQEDAKKSVTTFVKDLQTKISSLEQEIQSRIDSCLKDKEQYLDDLRTELNDHIVLIENLTKETRNITKRKIKDEKSAVALVTAFRSMLSEIYDVNLEEVVKFDFQPFLSLTDLTTDFLGKLSTVVPECSRTKENINDNCSAASDLNQQAFNRDGDEFGDRSCFSTSPGIIDEVEHTSAPKDSNKNADTQTDLSVVAAADKSGGSESSKPKSAHVYVPIPRIPHKAVATVKTSESHDSYRHIKQELITSADHQSETHSRSVNEDKSACEKKLDDINQNVDKRTANSVFESECAAGIRTINLKTVNDSHTGINPLTSLVRTVASRVRFACPEETNSIHQIESNTNRNCPSFETNPVAESTVIRIVKGGRDTTGIKIELKSPKCAQIFQNRPNVDQKSKAKLIWEQEKTDKSESEYKSDSKRQRTEYSDLALPLDAESTSAQIVGVRANNSAGAISDRPASQLQSGTETAPEAKNENVTDSGAQDLKTHETVLKAQKRLEMCHSIVLGKNRLRRPNMLPHQLLTPGEEGLFDSNETVTGNSSTSEEKNNRVNSMASLSKLTPRTIPPMQVVPIGNNDVHKHGEQEGISRLDHINSEQIDIPEQKIHAPSTTSESGKHTTTDRAMGGISPHSNSCSAQSEKINKTGEDSNLRNLLVETTIKLGKNETENNEEIGGKTEATFRPTLTIRDSVLKNVSKKTDNSQRNSPFDKATEFSDTKNSEENWTQMKVPDTANANVRSSVSPSKGKFFPYELSGTTVKPLSEIHLSNIPAKQCSSVVSDSSGYQHSYLKREVSKQNSVRVDPVEEAEADKQTRIRIGVQTAGLKKYIKNMLNTDTTREKHDKTAGSIIESFCEANIEEDIPATCVVKFGRQGHGPGDCLFFPIGVTVNKDGHIIVADTGNHLVKIFSRTGHFLFDVGKQLVPQFRRPSAVVVNDKNDIFVKDDICVYSFAQNGRPLRRIGINIFHAPYGLDLTSDGKLIVLDVARNRPHIVQLSQDGEEVLRYDYQPLQEFHRNSKCRFLAVNNKKLVVSDLGENMIYVTNLQGCKNFVFGHYGYEAGQFKEPSGVTVDNRGNILIGDSKNNRIQIFNSEGVYRCQLKFQQPIVRPSGIHFTHDGLLVISNFIEHQVSVYKLG